MLFLESDALFPVAIEDAKKPLHSIQRHGKLGLELLSIVHPLRTYRVSTLDECKENFGGCQEVVRRGVASLEHQEQPIDNVVSMHELVGRLLWLLVQ